MSLTFEFPSCLTECVVEGEDLPDRVCDDADYECPHCDQEMKIGWYATVEIRSVTVEAGDLVNDLLAGSGEQLAKKYR